MTPADNKYSDRLMHRSMELVNSRELQSLIEELKASGETPEDIDVAVFFSLLHEGYQQRRLEEKFWEDADWDYQI
jgi:hypothetical protein